MSVTIAEFQQDMPDLLRRIAAQTGRLEIRDDDGASECVLISKKELESLEHALELLSTSDGMRSLCDSLAHWASIDSATPPTPTPPC